MSLVNVLRMGAAAVAIFVAAACSDGPTAPPNQQSHLTSRKAWSCVQGFTYSCEWYAETCEQNPSQPQCDSWGGNILTGGGDTTGTGGCSLSYPCGGGGGGGNSGGGSGGSNYSASDADFEEPSLAEISACIAHPVECSFTVNPSRTKAGNWIDQIAGNQSRHNNIYDAMRHAYWSALMARSMGADRAKFWGDLHEEKEGQDPLEKCMDLFNNAVGRGIAASLPSNATDAQLQQAVYNAASNNQLRSSPSCN